MNISLTFPDKDKEIAILKEFGLATGKKAMDNILLNSARKILVPAIKRNAPVASGRTIKDVRAKIVDSKNQFESRVIVGVRKSKDKSAAGWYTHMILLKKERRGINRKKRTTLTRHVRLSGQRNTFVEQATESSREIIRADLLRSVDVIIERYRKKLAKN